MSDSFATPRTVACQASLSKGFSQQEYWSGLPFHSPGDVPDLSVEPGSPALQANSLPSEPPGKPNRLIYMPVLFNMYYSIDNKNVIKTYLLFHNLGFFTFLVITRFSLSVTTYLIMFLNIYSFYIPSN